MARDCIQKLKTDLTQHKRISATEDLNNQRTT